MTELHQDVQEIVVRLDGEEIFSYYRAAGGLDVLVDPERRDERGRRRV